MSAKNWILIITAALFVFFVLPRIFASSFKTEEIGFRQFQEEVESGNVPGSVRVEINGEIKTIKGILKKSETGFSVTTGREDVFEYLDEHDIFYIPEQVSSNGWGRFLPYLLPLLLFGLLLFFLMKQLGAQSKKMSDFSKSKADIINAERPNVFFDDVAGVDEAKEEVKEVVEFLKNPEKFHALGARIPKGVLLVGPPGTGKTLLARAVAGEADASFFVISGSEFVEVFVGVGASRVRDLFSQAEANSPAIIFIDEIDAVGRQREAGFISNPEREQTLDQILKEMDGFNAYANVVVIAATNRPDVLDPALIRPGRFDRQIILDLPDVKGRQAILEIHARGKPLAPEVNLEETARATSGFSGADLENLLNEAAILTARRDKQLISQKEIEEAIDRVMMGPQRKSQIISLKEKEIKAFHEAGHALVGWVLPNVDPLRKISIISRGRAGGYTRFLPEEDRNLLTKSYLQEMMAVTLAGRVAEELEYGEPSTGAENDLDKVREISWRMVVRYGMAEGLPLQSFANNQGAVSWDEGAFERRDYGEEVASKIDQAKANIIETARLTAKAVLEKYRDDLKKIAEALIKKETLEGKNLEKLFRSIPKNKWPLD